MVKTYRQPKSEDIITCRQFPSPSERAVIKLRVRHFTQVHLRLTEHSSFLQLVKMYHSCLCLGMRQILQSICSFFYTCKHYFPALMPIHSIVPSHVDPFGHHLHSGVHFQSFNKGHMFNFPSECMWLCSHWTMLLIRALGARIRTSLVCEGSLHVMSFKMVVSLFASRRCTAECCMLPYSLTMWLRFSSISNSVRMS